MAAAAAAASSPTTDDASGSPFLGYASISHERDKRFMPRVREMAARAASEHDDDFVVTEKVDGCNLGFTVEATPSGDITVRVGRRNDFLTTKDSFHNWQAIAAKYTLAARDVFIIVRDNDAEPNSVKRVIVYGELYGGVWHDVRTGTNTGTGSAPQNHIHYCRNGDFIAFDVHVTRRATDADGSDATRTSYLTTEQLQRVCAAVGIPFVPTRFRGTFEQAMAWCAEHLMDRTRIPELHVDARFGAAVTRRDDHEAMFSMRDVPRGALCPVVGARVVFEHDGNTFSFRVVEVTGNNTFVARGAESEPILADDGFETAVTSFLTAPPAASTSTPTTPSPPGSDIWACEGFVIKHARERTVLDEFSAPGGDRMVLKYKSPAFSELISTPASQRAKPAAAAAQTPARSAPQTTPHEAELQMFLTDARISNVLSKLTDAEKRNFAAVADSVVADAWSEYRNNHATDAPETPTVTRPFLGKLAKRVKEIVSANDATSR